MDCALRCTTVSVTDGVADAEALPTAGVGGAVASGAAGGVDEVDVVRAPVPEALFFSDRRVTAAGCPVPAGVADAIGAEGAGVAGRTGGPVLDVDRCTTGAVEEAVPCPAECGAAPPLGAAGTPSAVSLLPARSPSPADGVTAASPAATVRGADGNVRRCTAAADVFAGACVSALRRGGTGGAGATRGPVAGAVTAGAACGTHATGTAPAAAEAGVAVVGVADDGRRTADVGPLTGAVCGVCAVGGVVDALAPFRTAPAGPGFRTAAPPPWGPANGTRCTDGAPALTDPSECPEPTEPPEPTKPVEPVPPAVPVPPP